MPKLQKFKKKTDKVSIKNLLISFGIILLGLTILGVYKTFAIYKIDKEYDLIVSKIGDFRGLNLITKYYINGIENSNIPTDKNYEVYVTCDNANGSWNYNNWKLNIEDATKYKVNCEIDFREKYVLASAKSTTNTITTTYSNIDTASSEYCMYGTDANNLDSRKDNDCNLTNLISDTTYYFKKCYTADDYNICSDVKSLLTGGKVTYFDYNGTTGADGSEQTYETICNGTYKLETWGAQGGKYDNEFIGGYGGYSIGKINLEKSNELYINIGGSGKSSSSEDLAGGYNGGGSSNYQRSFENNRYFASGGGATHIAFHPGLLSTLEKENKNILIVSGGGGASYYSVNDNINNKGGSAGGYIGVNGEQTTMGYGSFGYGGTQTAGGNSICDETTCDIWTNGISSNFAGNGSFGKGGVGVASSNGGGGGYYGGGASVHVQSAGGGSGYIGNPLLTNKTMYCYECQESNEENTKTVSTTCASSTPTQNCAKIGNGYARITIDGCSI